MKTILSEVHKQRLEAMNKLLGHIGSNEGSFVKIELLFFEALDIARHYGTGTLDNPLLTQLHALQNDAYQKTNALFKKRSQREVYIRRFISQFKKVIAGKSSAVGIAVA